MDDIKLYLKYYSDYSFFEEKFNDVDNVIFSHLSYINFIGIVPSLGNGCIKLRDAANLYFSNNSNSDSKMDVVSVKKAIYILKKIANSKRYGDILLYNYKYEFDNNSQFGALSIKLPDKSVFISFEGTDSLLSGWKEDFMFAYKFPTVSQDLAIKYLNSAVGFMDHVVRVGGHSKGGNLAMVSSMFCHSWIRKRIVNIYNNDGPGLRKEEFQSKNYKEIFPKLKHIIPDNSFIGLLLYHSNNYIVVPSTTFGLIQHDASTWCCYGGHFVKGKLSKTSKRFDIAFSSWLDKYTDLQKEELTNELFGIFEECGVNDLKELMGTKIVKVIKLIDSTKTIDEDVKNMVKDCLKSIVNFND